MEEEIVSPVKLEPVETNLQCTTCMKVFKSNRTLTNHVKRIHQGLDLKVCSECGSRFSTGYKLKCHIEIVHQGLKKFPCLYCEKSLSSKDSLDNHMRIHTGEKPFICVACGKGFTDPSGLHCHMKMHDPNRKLFKCHICGKDFTRNSFLKTHLKLHDNEHDTEWKEEPTDNASRAERKRRQGVAKYERRIYTNQEKMVAIQFAVARGTTEASTALNIHRATLDSWMKLCKSPLSCDECGFLFPNKSGLDRHKSRVHKVETDYQKDNTQPIRIHPEAFKAEVVAFAHSNSMELAHKKYNVSEAAIRRWVRINSNPFSCNQCGKMFAYEKELTRHEIRHLATKEEKQIVRKDIDSQMKLLKPFSDFFMALDDKPVFPAEKTIEKVPTPSLDPARIKEEPEEPFFPEPEVLMNTDEGTETEPQVDTKAAPEIERKINEFGDRSENVNIFQTNVNPYLGELDDSDEELDEDIEGDFFENSDDEESYREAEENIMGIQRIAGTKNNGNINNSLRNDEAEENMMGIQRIAGTKNNGNINNSLRNDIDEDDSDSDLEEINKFENVKDSSESAVKMEDSVKLECDGELETGFIKPDEIKLENVENNEYLALASMEMGLKTESSLPLSSSIAQKQALESEVKRRGPKSNLNREKPVCPICGQTFKNKFYLNRHQVTHTGEKNFTCELCPARFAFKQDVSRHIKTVHATEKQHICPHCGKGYSQKHGVDKHIRVVHEGIRPPSERKHICDVCGEGFCEPRWMEEHKITVHTKNFPFYCDDCGKGFIKSRFLVHQKKCPFKKAIGTNGENPDGVDRALQFLRECHICGKQFSQGSNLRRHIKSHFKIKDFPCTICNEKYADKRNLQLHFERTHPEEAKLLEVAERKYCDQCPQHFQYKRDLELHKVNEHNQEYHYTCSCGQGFIKTNFMSVISRHRRECPKMDAVLRCKVCDTQFVREKDLEVHMRKHSEKPCICEECGKPFADATSLERHVALHGVKAFYCNLCGKPFSSQDGLSIHMKTHTESSSLSCQLGGDTFTDGTNFKEHFLSQKHDVHSVVRNTEVKLNDDIEAYTGEAVNNSNILEGSSPRKNEHSSGLKSAIEAQFENAFCNADSSE